MCLTIKVLSGRAIPPTRRRHLGRLCPLPTHAWLHLVMHAAHAKTPRYRDCNYACRVPRLPQRSLCYSTTDKPCLPAQPAGEGHHQRSHGNARSLPSHPTLPPSPPRHGKCLVPNAERTAGRAQAGARCAALPTLSILAPAGRLSGGSSLRYVCPKYLPSSISPRGGSRKRARHSCCLSGVQH